MVIKNASSLFKVLDSFNSSNTKQLEALENLLDINPDFHLARTYYLNAVQQLKPANFDKQLSHTAIATYDRNLLYDFIEKQEKNVPVAKVKLKPEVREKQEKNVSKNLEKRKLKKTTSPLHEEKTPKVLSFSDWASYLKTRKVVNKENPTLENKFKLIDSFLANIKKIEPDEKSENKVDLSEKSWASSDELMTETLAKVFVKQEKYHKALQAYQILGLKYPEKNSFFADQIKEIKRLQKLKD